MSESKSPSETHLEQSVALLNYLVTEQKRARRRTLIRYGMIAVFVLAYGIFLAALAMRNSTPSAPDQGYVSLVRLEGEIGPGKAISAEKVNPLLTKAFEDEKAKGVILVMNSPGGSPVQSSLIFDHLQRLRAENPAKKLVVVGEDLVASGGYFIASAADKIVVNRSTVTGSIGVITASFGFSSLMEKIGVERRVITAGEAKNSMDPFVPQKEEDQARTRELIADIHEHFIDAVKAGRGDRLDLSTPELFSGKVWTGSAAVRHGLADELGDVDTVLKNDFAVTEFKSYNAPKPFLDSLLSGALTMVRAQVLADSTPTPQLLLK